MDDPNDSEDDPVADNGSNIQLENTIEGTRIPEHGNVRAATNVPELIRPTWRSNPIVENLLMTVNTMETRRTKGIMEK
jgi:hypothetical protein